ncbi:MAG: hypothetical protein ACJ8EY_09055, partial [Sphingomicrobium sp.]
MVKTLAAVIVTAILVSAFWIFYQGMSTAPSEPNGKVATRGDVVVVDPPQSGPVAVAESIEVGPAGLAIPVVGVKPKDLVD